MAFPENPETVILKHDNYNFSKDIREQDVWNYYDALKSKIIPNIKGFDLFIVIHIGNKNIYKRHPFDGKTEFIRINNTADFDEYNTGRVGEFHITSPKKSEYFVLDLDPGVDLTWGDIKRGTLLVYDYLNSLKILKNIEIYFTGSRSFHIWCYLKEKNQDIADIKKEWLEILRNQFENNAFISVNKSPKKNQINIDFSPIKYNGGHVAPFSLRLETGLVAMEIAPKKLMQFKKIEATFDKIYKKITGKSFPWKITNGNALLAKEIQDYLQFVQTMLEKNYGKNKKIFDIKDKERHNFFKQVQELWENNKKTSLTQPLVSIPPYRGNFLDYLKEKNIKESAYRKEDLIQGYKGKFIIHQHDARSLHWDLRLEFPSDSLKNSLKKFYTKNEIDKEGPDKEGPVLRSWAIPKHRIPKDKEKLLAVETEPHPMDILKFEGDIPEGQYGAGTVEIYDSGTFEIVDVFFDKTYEVMFKGNKLKGYYSLIKMGKGPNFLWFKSSGKTASIIDYAQPSLAEDIWNISQKIPKIHDNVCDAILQRLNKSIDSVGFKNKEEWLYDTHLVGSTTTNQYTDTSDIDINVQIDYDLFRKNNPEFNITDDYELRNFIREKVYPLANGQFNEKRTIKYFIIGLDFFLESDYYFDLINKEWRDNIVPELIDINFNPNIVFKKEKEDALALIKNYNYLIEKISILLRDIFKIKKLNNPKLDFLTKNLEEDILLSLKKLRKLDKEILEIRKIRFNKPFEELEFSSKNLSKNWEYHNVIYKFLNLYGYHDLFENLENRIPEYLQNLYNYYRIKSK